MFKRKTAGEIIFQFFLVVFLLLFSAITLYPFWDTFRLSISTPVEAAAPGFRLFPSEITFSSYVTAFSSDIIARAFWNSTSRTVLGTFLSLLVMISAAYPLSKRYLPHRNFYTTLIIITMFISGGLIPTFLLVSQLGLINTFWALIFPGLIDTWSLIILRNYFQSLPPDLEESAKLDGANDIFILFRIIIPLATPVIATVTLWAAVGRWNAWFDNMIYTSDWRLQTLGLFLRKLVIQNEPTSLDMLSEDRVLLPQSLQSAAIFITMAPILIVYPFLQRYFVKGIMVGSLKG